MRYSLALGLVLFCSFVNGAKQIYIEGDELGQGFVTTYLGKCFFVAPEHVVKNSLFLNLVGDSSQRLVGEGQVIQAFGYDLAVGSVEGSLAKRCQTPFNRLEKNTELIESNTTLAVSTVNSDGLASRQTVVATETTLTHIFIQPVSDEHSLYKGMSGSLLFSGEQPLGMLQSVDAQTGFGKVLRFDRLLETINPFFNSSSKLAKRESSEKTQVLDNIAFEISEWSHTTSNVNASINAISDNDESTAWSAVIDKDILELVISFEESTEISGVTLISSNEGKATVKSFEVFISKRSQGKRGWLSKASMSTFPQTTKNELTWQPLKAKRIKIRVFNSWQADGEIHINELMIH